MRMRPESLWHILFTAIIVAVLCFDLWLLKIFVFPEMSYVWVFLPLMLTAVSCISFALFIAFAWIYSVMSHMRRSRRGIQ